MPSASEGSRPWRRRPTRSTPGCSRSSRAGRWSRRSGCRPRRCAQSGSGPGSDCTWSAIGRRSKNGISATLMTFGHPCPMADLFGVAGRKLLDSLALPEPWQASLSESLALVDDLTARVDALEVELRDLGADDPSMQLLMTVPGVGWVLAYTIASEIGDITRFATPKKLAGYTGLCPLVRQSGPKDRRGPLAKNGPKYLRWALVEAATHAARDVRYVERYERTKQRLGRQRGAKVARVDLARQLAEAIWHVLTKNEPFHPAGPAIRLVA